MPGATPAVKGNCRTAPEFAVLADLQRLDPFARHASHISTWKVLLERMTRCETPRPNQPPITSNIHLLLAYVADLELEVDRLRKQGQFVRHEVRDTLRHIQALAPNAARDGSPPGPAAEIDLAVKQLLAVLHDLQGPPGDRKSTRLNPRH